MTDALDKELAAYEKMRQELESRHMGKWVVFFEQKLIATYDSFDAAAQDAVTRFGRGPYLIRQVGAPAITLPASVMFTLCEPIEMVQTKCGFDGSPGVSAADLLIIPVVWVFLYSGSKPMSTIKVGPGLGINNMARQPVFRLTRKQKELLPV